MQNNTNRSIGIASLLLIGFSSTVVAHDKVVVIPMGGDEAAKEKVIFITKTRYHGGLGGLSGADAKCQADADASDSKVKGKIFKAWLNSTDPLAAGGRSFKVYDLPYVTPTGDEFASSYSSLINMNPWPFLKYAANGVDVTSPTTWDEVWTGRDFQGNQQSAHCTQWTSAGALNGHAFAESSQSSQQYTQHKVVSCSIATDPPRIICMEQ